MQMVLQVMMNLSEWIAGTDVHWKKISRTSDVTRRAVPLVGIMPNAAR